MKAWFKPVLKAAAVVLVLGMLGVTAVIGWWLWLFSQLPH